MSQCSIMYYNRKKFWIFRTDLIYSKSETLHTYFEMIFFPKHKSFQQYSNSTIFLSITNIIMMWLNLGHIASPGSTIFWNRGRNLIVALPLSSVWEKLLQKSHTYIIGGIFCKQDNKNTLTNLHSLLPIS